MQHKLINFKTKPNTFHQLLEIFVMLFVRWLRIGPAQLRQTMSKQTGLVERHANQHEKVIVGGTVVECYERQTDQLERDGRIEIDVIGVACVKRIPC